MAVDYGTDISTYRDGDLDRSFTLISGTRVLAEAIARRLETPRGALIGDPNYGTDIRGWLNKDFVDSEAALFRLKTAIEDEASKDERVIGAEATVLYDPAEKRLRITIAIEGAAGPFDLVLAVSQVRLELLSPSFDLAA